MLNQLTQQLRTRPDLQSMLERILCQGLEVSSAKFLVLMEYAPIFFWNGAGTLFCRSAFPSRAYIFKTTWPVSSNDLRLDRIRGQPPDTASMSCDCARSIT